MSATTIDTPQSIPELASRAFNHEAKLMVFMALDCQPTALTASQLHRAMNEPQQEYPTWVPNSMAAYSYCRQSLVPAGTVSEELVIARQIEARAHRLTDYGERLAVPAAGFLLDWSLRYPNVSLQDLLGNTNSSGKFRAGETRSRVLEDAISAPAIGGLSVRAAFADVIDPDWESLEYKQERTRISKAVNALAVAGILCAETVEFDDDRELLIVDPHMPDNVANQPRYEVARALYEVIAVLDAKRTDRDAPLAIGYNDAVVLTLNRLSDQGLQVDPMKVRRAIHNAYFSQRFYKGITKADPARFNDGALTRFRVKDDHNDAVEEFLSILKILEDDDERMRREGLGLLQEVKQDPAQRAQIMSKAFAFSPYAQKKSTLATAVEVETLVAERGQGTLHELTDAYREMVGRPIKSETMRNVLVLLVARGKVVVEMVANADKPGYQLKRNLYTAAQ